MQNSSNEKSVLTQPNSVLLPNEETKKFILEHISLSPTEAALLAHNKPNVDAVFALNQIAGKQIAKQKLPLWAQCEEVIYPTHLSMEQCSSQATAKYKAQLAKNLLSELETNSEKILVDLTGGFGVDCTLMSEFFDSAICIEQQSELSSISQHNMNALCHSRVNCYNNNCIESLEAIEKATIIYIDPARRNANGERTYAIEDCTPNVLNLKNKLLKKAKIVIVKLSPMLDWHKAVQDFNGNVSSLHIIASHNECKELLLVVDSQIHENLKVYCVNDQQITKIRASYDSETQQVKAESIEYCESKEDTEDTENSENSICDKNSWQNYAKYVYEPNAALMKIGCFSLIEKQYHTLQLQTNSHVFVSAAYNKSFPGKIWKIENVCSMNKKEIKKALENLTHANIVTRNFPMSAETLRKRLHIQNGGNTRLIATTDSNNQHILIRAAETETEK